MTRKINLVEGSVGAGATVVQVASGPAFSLNPRTFAKADGIGPDTPAWYLFFNRNIELFGRDNELEILSDFCSKEDKFLFLHLYGPGGVGKSRLVYEFIESRKSMGWAGGFLDDEQVSVQAFAQWEPDQPTVWAIDYCGRHLAEIPALIASLAAISRNWTFNVRIIFIERFNVYDLIAARAQVSARFHDITSSPNSFSPPIYLPPLNALAIDLFEYCLEKFGSSANLPESRPDESRILALTEGGNPLLVAFAAALFASKPTSLELNFDRNKLVFSILDREIAHMRRELGDKKLLEDAVLLIGLSCLVGGLPLMRSNDFVIVHSEEQVLLIKSGTEGKLGFPTMSELLEISPEIASKIQNENNLLLEEISQRLSISDPSRVIDGLRFNPVYENLKWQIQPDLLAEALVSEIILRPTLIDKLSELFPYVSDKQISPLISLSLHLSSAVTDKTSKPMEFLLRLPSNCLGQILKSAVVGSELNILEFSRILGAIIERREDALEIIGIVAGGGVAMTPASYRWTLIQLSQSFLLTNSPGEPTARIDALLKLTRQCCSQALNKPDRLALLLVFQSVMLSLRQGSNIRARALCSLLDSSIFKDFVYSFPFATLVLVGSFDKILLDPKYDFTEEVLNAVTGVIGRSLAVLRERTDISDIRRVDIARKVIGALSNLTFAAFRRNEGDGIKSAAIIAPVISDAMATFDFVSLLDDPYDFANECINMLGAAAVVGDRRLTYHLMEAAFGLPAVEGVRPLQFKMVVDLIALWANGNRLHEAAELFNRFSLPTIDDEILAYKGVDIPTQFRFMVSSLLDSIEHEKKEFVFFRFLRAFLSCDAWDERIDPYVSALYTLAGNLLFVRSELFLAALKELECDSAATDGFKEALKVITENVDALKALAIHDSENIFVIKRMSPPADD